MASPSEIEKLERRWLDNMKGLTFVPLAEAYRKAGRFDEALQALELGLENHPEYVPAHIVRGRCNLDIGDDAEAEKAFDRVLELDAENVIALKGRGEIQERRGLYQEAERTFLRLLELDPTNDEASIRLYRVREHLGTAGLKTSASTAPVESEAEPPGEVVEAEKIGVVHLFKPAEIDPAEVSQGPNEYAFPDAARELTRDAEAEIAEEPSLADVKPADPLAQTTEYSFPNAAGTLRDDAEGPDALGVVPEDVEEADAAPSLEGAREVSEYTFPNASWSLAKHVEPGAPVDTVEDAPEPAAQVPGAPFEEDLPAPEPEVSDEVSASPWDAWRPREEPAEEAEAPVVEGTVAEGEMDAAGAEAVREATWESDEVTPGSDDTILESEAPEGVDEQVSSEDEVTDQESVEAYVAPWSPSASAMEEPQGSREADASEPDEVAADSAPVDEAPEAQDPVAQVQEYVVQEYDQEYDEDEGADEAVEPVDVEMSAPVRQSESERELAPEPEPAELAQSEEPELVVTETMAEVFERQGHLELALAVYVQLAKRAPDDPRLASAIERLQPVASAPAPTAEPSAPPRQYAAADTGGQSIGEFLQTILESRHRVQSAPVLRPAIDPGVKGEPTRPSGNSFSLSSVFGDEGESAAAASNASGTTEAAGTAMSEPSAPPSYDEFFGSEAEVEVPRPQPGMKHDPDDLVQFNEWLKGLKR